MYILLFDLEELKQNPLNVTTLVPPPLPSSSQAYVCTIVLVIAFLNRFS